MFRPYMAVIRFFSPLRFRLPLVMEKMASIKHKAFSVLEFSKISSVIMVQRAFRRRYGINPPLAKNIRRSYEQFQKQDVYVRGRVQGDHALQRKMCTEFKRLFSEDRASPLVVLAENIPSLM